MSVYVLRERLQESWEKREALRQREEELLGEAADGLQSKGDSLHRSLYDVALDAVVEGTQGHDTLQSWRSRYLTANPTG